jgi:hypothetical protein
MSLPPAFSHCRAWDEAFQRKRALVTGGYSGIGLETTRRVRGLNGDRASSAITIA